MGWDQRIADDEGMGAPQRRKYRVGLTEEEQAGPERVGVQGPGGGLQADSRAHSAAER